MESAGKRLSWGEFSQSWTAKSIYCFVIDAITLALSSVGDVSIAMKRKMKRPGLTPWQVRRWRSASPEVLETVQQTETAL
jgi:hypothetical protein